MLHENTVDDVDSEQESLELKFEFVVQINQPVNQDRSHCWIHIYLLLYQFWLNLNFAFLPLHINVNLLSVEQEGTRLRLGQ